MFQLRDFRQLQIEKELEGLDELLEKLKPSDPTSKYISDFVHSDNPKFAGKSKKERIRMALGAKYGAMRKMKEELEQIDELRRETLASYVSKAAGSYGRDKQVIGRESPDGTVAKARPELKRAVKNRLTGINRAAERLAKG